MADTAIDGYTAPQNQPAVTSGDIDAWVHEQQMRLDAGLPLGPRGIPPGYKIDGNQIVQQNAWDTWGKGATIGMATGIAGGYGAGYLNDLVSGASSLSSAAPTLEATMNAEQAGSIPSAFGMNAVDTVASAPPGGAGLTDWLKAAKNTGDALSGMSAGRAQGRLGESLANQAQNRTAVDLYNSELNAPRTIARNAVKGDVLAHAQDVSFSNVPSTIPVPTLSGGFRPSMFSDATRQTGRNISQAAANTPIPSPTAPILPPLPEAGGFDDFLNGASGVAGLASATAPLWRKYVHL